MRLTPQFLRIVWIVSASSLLCAGTPLVSDGTNRNSQLSSTNASLESKSDRRSIVPSPIEESDETEEPGTEDGEDEGDEGDEEDDDPNGDDTYPEETATDPSVDFDDADDLEAIAKGVLGSVGKKDGVVPCFGTWWPVGGGYTYYYADYGGGGGGGAAPAPGGGDGDPTADYGGDYGRRRNRRRRRRRNRMRRAKRNRTARKKKA